MDLSLNGLMLKTIFFDCDGVIVLSRERFGQKFADEFDVPEAKLRPFFQNEFLLCKLGKADLKQELQKYLPQWGWKKSAEDLMKYWFESENQADRELLDYISSLRAQGVKCFMVTNNEKYRADYLYYHLALSTIFDGFFPSWQVGFLKSQPEFWQKIYRYDMGNRRQIVVVDDDPAVVGTARHFGFFGHQYISSAALQEEVEFLLRL